MTTQPLARARLAPVEPTASHRAARLVPASVRLDDADTPTDVVDSLILHAFVDGSQPFARTARLREAKPEAALMPPGAQVIRSAADDGRVAVLAAGDGWTLRAVRWRTGLAELTVTAITGDVAVSVLKAAIAGAAADPPARAGVVRMGFWHRTGRRGPVRAVREVSVEAWASIRGNYSGNAASALDRLMAVTPRTVNGRLILLHGPPGTGNTTALRGLAREWQPWCAADCVLDPDALFSDPGYLMEVAGGRVSVAVRFEVLRSGELTRVPGPSEIVVLSLLMKVDPVTG